MAAFESTSPVPYSDVNLKQRTGHSPSWGDSSLSEVSTIQLEFNYFPLFACLADTFRMFFGCVSGISSSN
jgi:hypothetical protein